jgi:photosystem II stability/assembly factor-like uncharacterized protein
MHVVVTGDGGATWRATFPGVPPGVDVTAASAMLDGGLRADGRGALFLQPADPRGGVPALYVYPTADGGRTWGQPARLDGRAASGPPRALFALDDAHWWASSGSGADLLVTADGGRTVTRRAGTLPAGYVYASIGFWSADAGWAVATSGGRPAVFVTRDAGASWTALRPPR